MKIAPLFHALSKETWAEPVIVHTGQHYDLNMSDAFFTDLKLPEPHIHLGVGSGSHAEQTGGVMIAYEKILKKTQPDLVVVVGDVNSTMAATLAAVKLGIKVGHLEAGLRSFDRTMPEEINRIVTDQLADILWTPSADGDDNLLREGISQEKIVRVGNIMIDSLEMMRPKIEKENAIQKFGLEKGHYALVTLHRPSNVDDSNTLKKLCQALMGIADKIPLFFAVHPRTKKNLEKNGLYSVLKNTNGMYLNAPVSYVPFMNLLFNCKLAITDSGGIQEETTYLGIPCLTLRPNTERPITITQGTNQLVIVDDLEEKVNAILSGGSWERKIPELWDGKTATRVVDSIHKRLKPKTIESISTN